MALSGLPHPPRSSWPHYEFLGDLEQEVVQGVKTVAFRVDYTFVR